MHSSFVIKETEAYNFDADWTRGKHEADGIDMVLFLHRAGNRAHGAHARAGGAAAALVRDFVVEQLLAGCEQNIDLRTPGIMLGL